MDFVFTQLDPVLDVTREAFAQKGWRVHHAPLREVIFPPTEPINWSTYDLITITSKQAARWFVRQHAPADLKLAVVGRTTASLLNRPLITEAATSAQALGERLRDTLPLNIRILMLQGESARPELTTLLAKYRPQSLVVYHTRKLQPTSEQMPPGMLYFQAPSTVWDFHECYRRPPLWIAVIGPTTAKAVRELDWPINFQPSRPETDVLLRELPRADDFT